MFININMTVLQLLANYKIRRYDLFLLQIYQKMRGMAMQQQNQDLRAEIKADVFTDIFDNMTKNMKQDQKIFLIINQKQIKIWLQQRSNATTMELKIDSRSFISYNCSAKSNNSIYRKYELKKFLYFTSFFQCCKGALKLIVNSQRIIFKDANGSRSSQFPVAGEQISENEQNNFSNQAFQNSKKNSNNCKLSFTKSKFIQEVIHSGNAMKIDKMYLSYLAFQKKLKFDFKKTGNHYLTVKAEKVISGNQISKVVFPFRKLKLATGLLQSEKQFTMTLAPDSLTINFDEQNKKKYNICILSQNLEDDNFA